MLALLRRFLGPCSWRWALALVLLSGFGRGFRLRGWGLLLVLLGCFVIVDGFWFCGGMGGVLFSGFFCLFGDLVGGPDLLAFPCILSGLLALPLCGAAPTFFAAAKKVSKESGLTPLAHKCPSLS
jgi:hypothetical protein